MKNKLLDEKYKQVYKSINQLIDDTGKKIGPILQSELEKRIEFVLASFNNEVKLLFSPSFEKWEIMDIQIKDFMNKNLKIENIEKSEQKSDYSELFASKFIKDVNFGPIRSK